MIDQSELNPNQYPAWAEFTPSGESLTKVSARDGFQLETLIDQSGTPTMARVGAGIIESGVDANGNWYRIYGDGWAECGGVDTSAYLYASSATGSVFYGTRNLTFPIEFAETPLVTPSAYKGNNVSWPGRASPVTTTGFRFLLGGSATSAYAYPAYRAEGWLA